MFNACLKDFYSSVITRTKYTGMTRAGGAYRIAVDAFYPAGGQLAESSGFHPLRIKIERGGAVQGGGQLLLQGFH